ncbi:hypothetical protein SC171_14925 [Pantoea cypripedii]
MMRSQAVEHFTTGKTREFFVAIRNKVAGLHERVAAQFIAQYFWRVK